MQCQLLGELTQEDWKSPTWATECRCLSWNKNQENLVCRVCEGAGLATVNLWFLSQYRRRKEWAGVVGVCMSREQEAWGAVRGQS